VGFWKLIVEDFKTVKQGDPAFRHYGELLFNYPGVWALFWYRIAHALHGIGLKLIARWVSGIGQALTFVDIHPGAQIGRRLFIDHATGIVIGETTVIGNDVLIYQQVTLGGVSLSKGKRHPTIEDNVTVGAGAKILGNITIGANAKVGANSVVIHDVPANSTAVGIPARVASRIDDNAPLSHNIMPDVDQKIFEYLLKRIAVLEHTVKSGNLAAMEQEDEALDEIYRAFIDSMK
jgi:serine O-acetyltransferase